MEIITSKSNEKVKFAKKLQEKKYREEENKIFVETKKVIFEAINSGLKPYCFFVEQDKQNIFENINSQVLFVSSDVLQSISTTVSPDGYVAIFEKPKSKKEYLGGNFLVLDKLQNPDNLGAIMRTALASNFSKLFLIDCVDEYSPKTIRASMGNQFKLNISHITYDDIDSLFSNAKLFVASMEGKNIFEIDNFDKYTGFVIGNEGNGVSVELKKKISNTLSLPMENGTESLNASVSSSIIMYYIYSKNYKK